MHAVALTARKNPDLLLLVGALEVEQTGIGAGIDLAPAQVDFFLAVGDFLPDGLIGVQGVAGLVHVAQLDRLADGEGAGVRLFLAGDHAEQRGLAGAVGADDADDAAGRQLEVQVLDRAGDRRSPWRHCRPRSPCRPGAGRGE